MEKSSDMDKSEAVLTEKLKDAGVIAACEQCGCCSSACPLTGKNDFNIRRIIRHVQLDLVDEVADSPLPWFCATCGRCEEACPNSVEILTGIRALRQLSPPEEVPEGPPCQLACPANVDIPGYLRLIAQGKVDEAYALILEKVPFPGILGRVCTHPCEDACKRGEVNIPIAICSLKRYAADNESGLWQKVLQVKDDTSHKVAIIGAGPAGLTAAFYLRKKGHQVTVFEALPEPGGMMRFGIPDYRLPKDILRAEIKQIEDIGVEIRTNTKVDSIDKLLEEGYDAVLLAVGAHHGQKLPIPGADLDGVLVNIPFLRDVNLGKEVKVGKRVVVLGGGNVAFDCARTALRLGATDVHIACLESRDGMLATPEEISWGEEEDIAIHNSQTFTRIVSDNGRVSGVECLDVRSFEFDSEGRLHIESIAGSEHILPADTVIFAIGQLPELELVEGASGIKTTKRRTLEVDPTTLATGKEGIFAAGDAVTGTTSVIEAIAAGRRAASSIDKLLGGNGNIEETLWERPASEPYTGRRDKGFADLGRVEVPKIPISERRNSFAEVNLGFDADKATTEAKRCLQCDLELIIGRVASHDD